MTKLGVIFGWVFLIFLFKTSFANQKLEEVGEAKIVIKTPITVVEQSQAINYFDTGSVKLKDARAKIVSCIEKFIFRTKSLKVDLRCYILMDDKSPGIMEYSAVLITDDDFAKNFDNGIAIFPPESGLKYWSGHFEFKTSSKKYAWINDEIYLARGVEMRGPGSSKGGLARYKLFQIRN